MTKSSEKKRSKKDKKSKKNKKKSKKKDHSYVICWDAASSEESFGDPIEKADSFDLTATADEVYVAPQDKPDGVRFVDSMPGCMYPETYESFNGGKKVVCSVEGKPVFEIEDYGSGMHYKYTNETTEKSIDYATLSYLCRIIGIMEAVRDSRILGNGWWVDNKGRVGDFNKLLQIYKEEAKKKAEDSKCVMKCEVSK